MGAVQQTNSGHPGTPMASAPLIYTLWQAFCGSTPTIRPGPTGIWDAVSAYASHAGQKIVDRAVAGLVPDGLFVGCLEIWMFNISPALAVLENRANKAFSQLRLCSRARPPLGLCVSMP
jgi:hypothetical protein